MDPNANLAEQSRLIYQLERDPAFMTEHHKVNRRRLSELRSALADWLSKRGFEPIWDGYPDASDDFHTWCDAHQR